MKLLLCQKGIFLIIQFSIGRDEMIWMYCPKCGSPMRSVSTGWICTELGCGCKLDVYGNQYVETSYPVGYSYEVDENPKEARQWM